MTQLEMVSDIETLPWMVTTHKKPVMKMKVSWSFRCVSNPIMFQIMGKGRHRINRSKVVSRMVE